MLMVLFMKITETFIQQEVNSLRVFQKLKYFQVAVGLIIALQQIILNNS